MIGTNKYLYFNHGVLEAGAVAMATEIYPMENLIAIDHADDQAIEMRFHASFPKSEVLKSSAQINAVTGHIVEDADEPGTPDVANDTVDSTHIGGAKAGVALVAGAQAYDKVVLNMPAGHDPEVEIEKLIKRMNSHPRYGKGLITIMDETNPTGTNGKGYAPSGNGNFSDKVINCTFTRCSGGSYETA
mgnify:CR=1 FL=1